MPYWTPNEQLMHRRQEQVCKHQKYKLWAHISEAKMDNRLWKAFSVCKVHLPTESAHATISTNQWLSFTHIHNCPYVWHCLYCRWVMLLQRVQNNLAHVFCDVGWHHADLLCDLHWLPVCNQVMFKVASLCYRSCRFQHTFHWHHTYQLTISDRLTPTSWTNYVPCIWNSLVRLMGYWHQRVDERHGNHPPR